MALGFCPCCDRLVSIEQGEIIPGHTKRRYWIPYPHDDEKGQPCRGHKRKID